MAATLIFKCTEVAGVGDYRSFATHAIWQPVTQNVDLHHLTEK